MDRKPYKMGMSLPVAPQYRSSETKEILSLDDSDHPLRKFIASIIENFMGKEVFITVEVIGDTPIPMEDIKPIRFSEADEELRSRLKEMLNDLLSSNALPREMVRPISRPEVFGMPYGEDK